ncbi:MAG: sulfotransferase [Novosphingobium sp.]|nr:sulfotransferase [Novosphingobium sp.]
MAGRIDVKAEIAWLHAEATRRSGLSDFGPEDYLAPLAMLVEAMNTVVTSEAGRAFWREELVGTLIPRAARHLGWKRNPAYREVRLEKPLVICGLPRTGTTALHKVMSIDPQFQGLENWLAIWPMPRPPREHWPDHPGYRIAAQMLADRGAAIPGLTSQHEVVVDEVDECMEVLKLGFVSNRYPSLSLIPDYDVWFQSLDELPWYREMADTYRLIGLHDDRPWLLKNPGHIVSIDALLAVFPDARVIVTHRDPWLALGSLCSILSHPRRLTVPGIDLRQTGPRELAYWSKGEAAMARARAACPQGQFLDIDHADFYSDPMQAIERIYRHFGLELTDEVAGRMRAWLAANPAGKHGGHSYDPAAFGLDSAAVRAAFAAEYREL